MPESKHSLIRQCHLATTCKLALGYVTVIDSLNYHFRSAESGIWYEGNSVIKVLARKTGVPRLDLVFFQKKKSEM
jgi:hypothetical protein